MTHSYWLAQSVEFSRWLDSSVHAGATSLDRAPGRFIDSAEAPPAQRPRRIWVILTRHSPV